MDRQKEAVFPSSESALGKSYIHRAGPLDNNLFLGIVCGGAWEQELAKAPLNPERYEKSMVVTRLSEIEK